MQDVQTDPIMHKKCRKRGKKAVTDAAKEARNAYRREWAKKNREKVKATQERYWAKKAERAAADQEEKQNGGK